MFSNLFGHNGGLYWFGRGAYLGRGRGNAFLNDLVDADSLVHVVDASGRSDAEGVDHGASKVGMPWDACEPTTRALGPPQGRSEISHGYPMGFP